jgi:very-short-patch-repair endonuclease
VPQPQHSIRALDGKEIWRLDFAWPDLKIALEYDGYEAHERRAVQDAARDEDLRRRGWVVIRATATDMREPTLLLGRLRAAFAKRGVNVGLTPAERTTRGVRTYDSR